MDQIFTQESKHLQAVLNWLKQEIETITSQLVSMEAEALALKQESWAERLDLKEGANKADNAVLQQFLWHNFSQQQELAARQGEYKKLLASPYFARLDFAFADEPQAQPEAYYIGILPLYDWAKCREVVLDWRTPLASLYYDADLGPTSYQTSNATISGELLAKKQLHITRGKLRLILDSGREICDELLKLVLALPAAPRLKEIVATIQKKQNLIIRSEPQPNLLLLGVAGSGKSSIALHRAAWLLYKQTELAARNLLILSPNRQFSAYIAELLPSLAIENCPCLSAEELEIDLVASADSSLRQPSYPEASPERLQAASQLGLSELIEKFTYRYVNKSFQPVDFTVAGELVAGDWLDQLFRNRYAKLAPKQRLSQIAADIRAKFDIESSVASEIEQPLQKMLPSTQLSEIYAALLNSPSFKSACPLLAKRSAEAVYDRVDLALLATIQQSLAGELYMPEIAYLLVDEAQDLLPLEHELLQKAFACKVNLFADFCQAIRFELPASYLSFLQELYALQEGHNIYRLSEAYRSSYEIVRFAASILGEQDIVALQRHGQAVQCFNSQSKEELVRYLPQLIAQAQARNMRSLALLAATEDSLSAWQNLFQQAGLKYLSGGLLPQDETAAVMLLTVNAAKGMEFDAVIILDANAANYAGTLERKKLYVAASRALHELYVCSQGEASPFLAFYPCQDIPSQV